MYDLSNYCFHLSMPQMMSYLRSITGNYDTMLVERSCTIKLALYSNSDSN